MYAGEDIHCFRCAQNPECRHCKKRRPILEDQCCTYCQRKKRWISERPNAIRSLDSIFCSERLQHDGDDTVDLNIFLQRQRPQIEEALRDGLHINK